MKVINASSNSQEISNIKVNINEKLVKLVNLTNGGGTLIYKGIKLEKPDGFTFVQQDIRD